MKGFLTSMCGLLAVAATASLLFVSPASADFGVRDAEGVLPDASAFWAGTCDTAAAPAFDEPIPAPGAGTRPPVVLWPGFFGSTAVPQSPTPIHCIDTGNWGATTGSPFKDWLEPPAWRLPPVTSAGSHPDATATFTFNPGPPAAGDLPDETVRDILVDLPAGVVGNPTAAAKCTQAEFEMSPHGCPPQSQIGVSTLRLLGAISSKHFSHYGVYNLEPRPGFTAELGIANAATIGPSVRIFAKARTDGDFGITSGVMQVPNAYPLIHQSITLWGVPWAAVHDPHRLPTGSNSFSGSTNVVPPAERQSYDPSWGPIRPFFTIETECDGSSPTTRLTVDSHGDPGMIVPNASALPDGAPDPGDASWLVYGSESPPMTGCGDLGFNPSFELDPTSNGADSPIGLGVDLSVPQNNEPPAPLADQPGEGTDQTDGSPGDTTAGAPGHWRSEAGRATAHLKDSVVTLPAGVSVNPSGATGLLGCSNEQVGIRGREGVRYVFNNGDPFNKDGGADGAECPDGSKIGTARVEVPLLEEPLTGEVVLGTPESTDPRSGGMFRLFIVLRSPERGLLVKIFGSATADGVRGEGGTGQLRATFLENPEVPFDKLELQFKDGPNGVLANPATCGARSTVSRFDPWSRAHLAEAEKDPVIVQSPWVTDANCGNRFAPSLAAGMDTRQARAHGSFSFRFSRSDGEQYLRGLTAKLPQGLLASVKHVDLCPDAQASVGACPLGSQIGIVDAKAGAGDPFVLEQKGRVYLTEGYKGGEYGLAVDIHPIAGPFRGAMALSPIVVRQAIHVDRKTAQVTAVSDPFPTIWHGVPLRVREVTVLVNRGGFMLNPSGCSARQVQATIVSAQGGGAGVANHFEASDCADLRFKPRLALRLTGRRQVRTGKHPGVRAVVRQKGVGEAGIEKAVVRLPKSLALDVDNAQALCEFEDGTKPDLENHCPEGSIVGRARAKTPLLKEDLLGNVYFVKNVRIDPDTGNEIRTLPMIVVALRGEIAVNLVGESSTTRSGKLVNTFDDVPDAPVGRFNLNIEGGRSGILAVTRTRRARINLCAKPRSHVAEADMDGQNGKRHDRNVRMKTPCRKRRPSAAKVCRKRTDSKPAFRRCVVRVKKVRAKRAAAKRKTARRRAAARG